MTESELKSIINKIRSAYNQNTFCTVNSGQYEIWKETMRNFTYDDIDKALDKHILKDKWPPKIADLTSGINEIKNETNSNDSYKYVFYENIAWKCAVNSKGQPVTPSGRVIPVNSNGYLTKPELFSKCINRFKEKYKRPE